jgi:iron complex outermembrane receptor protein
LGPARLQAQPQTTTGTIRGTVDDPTGNAVLNAVVEARNETTGAESKTNTDEQGKFSIGGLTLGSYLVEVSAPGFAPATHAGVKLAAGQVQELSFSLVIGDINQAITVEAATTNSVAAQLAPMDGLLEARSARTEISPMYLREFTSPLTDFNETLDMAPGTYSYSQNGDGLGQSKLFFRGFPDGDYDINYDNVPFYDTNTPTHHTWCFFPGPDIGSVDFDRSPGDATSTGPTPFGGTINLLSPEMPNDPSVRLNVTGSSWNTILTDLAFDYGSFGPGKKSNLIADVNHLDSGGYENYNYQTRTAGLFKYQLKISENNTLTMLSSVVVLDSDTSNFNGPTRAQIQNFGNRFYLTNVDTPDPTSGVLADFYPLNYHFYTYHIPTDTEYIDWKDELGHGWQVDFQPYTLSYYNHQFYNNPSYNSDGLTFAAPKAPASPGAPYGLGVGPSTAVDKLNSYRKYGENSMLSQSSKYGIFRVGVWYEWAKTDRFQIPSSPLTHVDALLPNFHEKFGTFSTQPFVEYEWHPLRRLTITGGFKFADFDQNLKQYQDQKTILCPGGGTLEGNSTNKITAFCMGGTPFEYNTASYKAYLPSADANFRILPNWSIYAQYSRGTIVPPSSAFDTSLQVVTLPKPTGVWVSQSGSVLKFKRVTVNGDLYYIHYANTYTSQTDPTDQSGIQWVASGDAVSKGVEGETNLYVGRGLSFYANGTVGTDKYVAGDGGLASVVGLWVANAPENTESIGVTWQQKYFDIGFFDKRIGPQWLDNNDACTPVATCLLSPLYEGAVDHQQIPVTPFNVTGLYFNYTIRKGSRLDQTALRFSVNNLQDSHGIVGVTAFTNSNLAGGKDLGYVLSPADQLTTLPGRSFIVSLVFGYEPKGR